MSINPVSINMVIINNKTISVVANYAKKISTKLLFIINKTGVTIKKGIVGINHPDIQLPKEDKFSLTGYLNEFDFSKWRAIISNLPKSNSELPLLQGKIFIKNAIFLNQP